MKHSCEQYTSPGRQRAADEGVARQGGVSACTDGRGGAGSNRLKTQAYEIDIVKAGHEGLVGLDGVHENLLQLFHAQRCYLGLTSQRGEGGGRR